jgi:hypothetical protein
MADDDEMTDEMDEAVEAEPDEAAEFDAEVVDPEDLEEADIEEEDFEAAGDDDDFDGAEDEDEDEEEEKAKDAPARRTATDEDDDDEDLLTADDVEADLDTILKDRLVSAEEAAGEDDDDEEPEDRTDPGDRLQPKRADEQLCSNCFLLVRNSAPGCPVAADDDCPIFGAG